MVPPPLLLPKMRTRPGSAPDECRARLVQIASSPLPNPPARGQSDQMASDSHQSPIRFRIRFALKFAVARFASSPNAQCSSRRPAVGLDIFAFFAFFFLAFKIAIAFTIDHQAGTKPFPTTTTMLQDQKPITTVSIQSPASSAAPSTPTSPLVHTLHAKPFTPSKPPNLAAAPFVPSSATTPPTTTLAASLLTNPANAFVLTSVPRQQAYVSPSKATSPTRTNTFRSLHRHSTRRPIRRHAPTRS
ncbi:hypothetical protein BCR44DRAFT_1041414 [Catenaria anguillulae PL171]|uniref:Uncharacterized protein n=1 Tax=Catenaria anguillulae PL171 TaxID=765915 RepID=A0A1Y2HTC7_9FUNG|nr:hypothetical protein BCR44DRAFT_1041414 [Catenaria anguillulae PL171]